MRRPVAPYLRVYAAIRTAHLERLASPTARASAPVQTYYHRSRYDFDTSLLPPDNSVARRSRAAVLWDLARYARETVEINEPMMIGRWVDLLAQVATIRLRDRLTRRRTHVVAYCIGNADPADELAHRSRPVPRPLGRLVSRLATTTVTRGVDLLVFGTEGARSAYARYVPHRVLEPRSVVVPALPSPCSCLATATSRESGVGVLFVGAFTERKGVRQLLDAWSSVAEVVPSAHLRLIGTGPLTDEVLAWADRRGDATVTIGPPRRLIHEAYRAARVVVLLSQPVRGWREQVGLPIVEALSHGCVVVASTETGLAAWLEEHGHGVLPAQSTTQQIVEAIRATIQEGPARPQVIGSLPRIDGRERADQVMHGLSSDAGTASVPHRINVAFQQGRGLRAWQERSEQSPMPGRWPYGLQDLALATVETRAIEVPPLTTFQRARVRIAGLPIRPSPRRPGAARVICWSENLAEQVAYAHPHARTYSGVIWATDRVGETSAPDLRRLVEALSRLDGLWCLSRPQVAKVRSWLGDRSPQVSYLRFGVDSAFYRPGGRPQQPLVVSAGGDRDRDPETLFAALGRVLRERPDVRCVVQTRSSIAAPDGVEVVRSMSHLALAELYREASLVLVPTRDNWHASGVTVALEAMSSGRAVVACDTPGMDDYIDHGRTGLLVPVGAPSHMASAVLSLLDDLPATWTMGERGRQRVEESFTTTLMCEALREIVLGTGQHPARAVGPLT